MYSSNSIVYNLQLECDSTLEKNFYSSSQQLIIAKKKKHCYEHSVVATFHTPTESAVICPCISFVQDAICIMSSSCTISQLCLEEMTALELATTYGS